MKITVRHLQVLQVQLVILVPLLAKTVLRLVVKIVLLAQKSKQHHPQVVRNPVQAQILRQVLLNHPTVHQPMHGRVNLKGQEYTYMTPRLMDLE